MLIPRIARSCRDCMECPKEFRTEPCLFPSRTSRPLDRRLARGFLQYCACPAVSCQCLLVPKSHARTNGGSLIFCILDAMFVSTSWKSERVYVGFVHTRHRDKCYRISKMGPEICDKESATPLRNRTVCCLPIWQSRIAEPRKWTRPRTQRQWLHLWPYP